jgi:uncharacterized protein (TIGR02265 family)
MSEAFEIPDWTASLDVEAHLAVVPRGGTVKGMFFQDFIKPLNDLGKKPATRTRYIAFKDYPLKEYMELALEVAPQIHPEQSLRESLRRLGFAVYPNFKSTMIGKAIFAIAGRDFKRVMELAGRAYKVAGSHGEVTLHHKGPGHTVAELREVYAFPDCLQLGIWEGGMKATGATGEITVRLHSTCDVDFEIHWQNG